MASTQSRGETFELGGFPQPVLTTLTPDIDKDQLLAFRAFDNWKTTLRSNLELQNSDENHAFHMMPFTLRAITNQSVDFFERGGKRFIGFIKLQADIRNEADTKLPGVAFLRDERLVVMTEQSRIPAGSLTFMEIPAGMLDDQDNFTGAAAREIEEETGFRPPGSELIDLTKLALEESNIHEKSSLHSAMYPSPGGSDEFIPIFLWEKELDRQEIEDLRGKLTGKKTQGEMITLQVCDYDNLWKEGARGAKTLAAWALYEGLNRTGRIKDEIMNRRKGKESNNEGQVFSPDE